jgi:hypothetical protein
LKRCSLRSEVCCSNFGHPANIKKRISINYTRVLI